MSYQTFSKFPNFLFEVYCLPHSKPESHRDRPPLHLMPHTHVLRHQVSLHKTRVTSYLYSPETWNQLCTNQFPKGKNTISGRLIENLLELEGGWYNYVYIRKLNYTYLTHVWRLWVCILFKSTNWSTLKTQKGSISGSLFKQNRYNFVIYALI